MSILHFSVSIPPSHRCISSATVLSGVSLWSQSLSLTREFSEFSLASTGVIPLKKIPIRMGGGPRTFPGGVSKWQWKRMQANKAKQLLKARLARERQIYEMRKRAELKAAVSELERPWETVEKPPNLFSVGADEQLKVLADRFQKPGGLDLWSERDGPQLFRVDYVLPSTRFVPKGVVHRIKPKFENMEHSMGSSHLDEEDSRTEPSNRNLSLQRYKNSRARNGGSGVAIEDETEIIRSRGNRRTAKTSNSKERTFWEPRLQNRKAGDSGWKTGNMEQSISSSYLDEDSYTGPSKRNLSLQRYKNPRARNGSSGVAIEDETGKISTRGNRRAYRTSDSVERTSWETKFGNRKVVDSGWKTETREQSMARYGGSGVASKIRTMGNRRTYRTRDSEGRISGDRKDGEMSGELRRRNRYVKNEETNMNVCDFDFDMSLQDDDDGYGIEL